MMSSALKKEDGDDSLIRAPIDWKSLGFKIIDPQPGWPPLYNLRFFGKIAQAGNRLDVHWSGPEISQERELKVPMEAGCFHYSHEYFEGLVAQETRDGRCLLFRPKDHARRAKNSAKILCMPPFPTESFVKACKMVVAINFPYLPPFESSARLYIRAFCIGINRQMGLGPSFNYLMMLYVYPVGNYYPTGLEPMPVYCSPMFDRVAERGTGKAKSGGNYVASYPAKEFAKTKGCGEFLYLDIATRQFLTESGSSNFFVLRQNEFLTPDEPSVLNSITNDSLQTIAQELMSLKVTKRRLSLKELATKGEQHFLEAGLCGTAARLTPVSEIISEDKHEHNRRTFVFPETGEQGGPLCQKLYQHLVAIQRGEEEDRWGWSLEVQPKHL